MSYTLAPIAVTIPTDTTGLIPGQQLAVSIPGELTTVAWVKIANESPCGLQVRNVTSGTDWIAPYSVDVYPVDGLNSSLQLSPYNILGVAAAQTPVSFLIVTWYSAGERPAGTYPVSLQRLTNVGNALTTSTSAANAFEQDFLSAFVLTGLISTKDGSVANQLDTTSGIAFLVQTDSSLGRVAPLASVHLTSAISSTYFLDLNPDGTLNFDVVHSTVPNHLTLATVATDGSGNIATVTDNRPLNATMLSAMAGLLTLPRLGTTQAALFKVAGSAGANLEVLDITNTDGGGRHWGVFLDSDNGVHLFDFTDGKDILLGNISGGAAWAGPLASIGGQASAGSFGVPVIVAQALQIHVTATTPQTVLNYTAPADGFYRMSCYVHVGNTGTKTISLGPTITDPQGATGGGFFFFPATTMIALNGWTGSSSNQAILTDPQTFYAKSGSAIQCVYVDSTGTPNDTVSVILERLA